MLYENKVGFKKQIYQALTIFYLVMRGMDWVDKRILTFSNIPSQII